MKATAPNEYNPESATPPGETLAEKLNELDLNVRDFAAKVEAHPEIIYAIISGEHIITPKLAAAFERVLKIPARFWLARQATYDQLKCPPVLTLTFGIEQRRIIDGLLAEAMKSGNVKNVDREIKQGAPTYTITFKNIYAVYHFGHLQASADPFKHL